MGSLNNLDKAEALEMPKELNVALAKNKAPLAYYESLNNSVKRGLL